MSPSTETHDASEAVVSTAPRPRPALGPKNGRFHQVPHIAGLILGVFSVLVFLWSISPVLRYYVHVPREYIDTLLLRRTGHQPVVGARRRAARGGARESQTHRLVAADDLPGPDRCSPT